MTTTEAPLGVMVTVDQCDRCPAKAVVLAMLPSKSQLLFCRHHAKEFAPALKESGAIMYDRSRE